MTLQQEEGGMNRTIAKILASWIPSERYRKAVRRTLCEIPSAGFVAKGRIGGGSRYKTLVVPRGFGHSGSGVIGDLISEYDDATVFCGADPGCSGRWAGLGKKNVGSFEAVNLAMYGGVMDLASAFGESRAWGKFKLLNFIHTVESLYRQAGVPIYDDAFLEHSRAFVSELVEASWRSVTPMAENMFFERREAPPDANPAMLNPLYAWRENLAESYVMRNLTREEYEAKARRYMDALLGEIPSKRVLVMDQLCSANLPPEEFAKYIGPFKMIPVYRDPRDVFCTGAERCMPWIPNEPKAFVKWFSSLGIDSLRDSRSPFVMTLRFEDLVLDYDRSVKKIEEFVGLSPERHDRPRSAFDPARSKANIGLWKKWPDRRAMDFIRGELEGYCHD